MKYYDTIYKENSNFCGGKPNKLLLKIYKKLPKKAEFLDLGCGQGKDAFFMSSKKFNVTAIDSSKVAIEQIKEKHKKKKYKNLKAICQNIKKFTIKPKKFFVINSANSLQFLNKKDSLSVIRKIKKNIIPGGFVIIISFTDKNPPSKRRKSCFEKNEMKKIFSDFKIIYYFEGSMVDRGHIGQPEPHKHGIVKIIAKKLNN